MRHSARILDVFQAGGVFNLTGVASAPLSFGLSQSFHLYQFFSKLTFICKTSGKNNSKPSLCSDGS